MFRTRFLIIPLLAPLCAAQCSLPKPVADGLAQLPKRLTGFARHRAEALTYLDFRCFDEARAAFERASREPNARSNPDLQAWYKAMLEFVAARLAWNQGRLAEARSALNSLADEYRPADINFRATLALAELLSQHPDPVFWERLQPKLRLLGFQRDMWRARHYLFTYDLNPSNGAARVRELEQVLRSELPIRQRLENLFILADVLRKAGRSTEALLLVASIEDEIGESAVDVELRSAYVRLCAALWDARARQGDPRRPRASPSSTLPLFNKSMIRARLRPNPPAAALLLVLLLGFTLVTARYRSIQVRAPKPRAEETLTERHKELIRAQGDLSKWLLGLSSGALVALLGLVLKEPERKDLLDIVPMTAYGSLLLSLYGAFLYYEATAHILRFGPLDYLFADQYRFPMLVQSGPSLPDWPCLRSGSSAAKRLPPSPPAFCYSSSFNPPTHSPPPGRSAPRPGSRIAGVRLIKAASPKLSWPSFRAGPATAGS